MVDTYLRVDNRAIVPVLWPAGLGRVENGGFQLQVSEDWRYVPETLDQVCDWATVLDDSDDVHSIGRHACQLVYQPSTLPEATRDKTFKVSVVLQGFLGDFNLAVLGNWNKCVFRSLCLELSFIGL